MAQRVEVHEECDRHLVQNGKSVEGDTAIIGFNGVWYALEACKTHMTKEVEPIQALVEELGRKLEGNSRAYSHLMKLAKEGVPATVTALPTADHPPVAQLTEVASSNGQVKAAKSNGQVKRKGRGGKVSAKPRRHHCLWCEGDHTFTSSTGLLLHLDTKHGLPKSMLDVFGLDCPLCGTHEELKLGVHMQSRHRGITVTEAFLKARDQGDKHGIAGPVFNKVPVLVA